MLCYAFKAPSLRGLSPKVTGGVAFKALSFGEGVERSETGEVRNAIDLFRFASLNTFPSGEGF